MNLIKRIGEILARLKELEARVAALESGLEEVKPPGVEFVAVAALEVEPAVEHAPTVTFDAIGSMGVWA